MPRARHEAIERRRERRREIRKRFWEEFIRGITDRLRRRFRYDVRRLMEEFEKTREKLRLLRDIIRGRARTVFIVRHQYFFRNKVNVFAYDKILADMPEEQRDYIVNTLRHIVEHRGVDPLQVRADPTLRYFISRFIAMYSRYPCKHNAYAVKLTPMTIRYFHGYRMTYYVIRWSVVSDVMADAYISRTRPVDFSITLFRYKTTWDIINSLTESGVGSGDWNDTVVASRDHMRNTLVKMPLRRAILQPHHVKYAFAKAVGKPESHTVMGHCSVYGIIGRVPKSSKIYEAGDRRIMGVRPRHRIKEILYIKGLRT